MSNQGEIKPIDRWEKRACPFCGNKKVSVSADDEYIYCVCCGSRGPRVDCFGMAVDLWNGDKGLVSFFKKNYANEKEEHDATNPTHYSRWKIEPLDFISANNLDFLRGNIIKYIMRYDAKGGLEDLKKARVYLEKLIEKAEKDHGKQD